MSLLGSSQSSDYGSIEQRRQEQIKIRTIWKYTALAVYGLLTFGLLSLMAKTSVYHWEIQDYKDFFFIDYRNIAKSSLNLIVYGVVALSVMVLYWSIFVAKSLVELELIREDKIERRRSVGLTLRLRIFLARVLTKPTYYIFFPISYLFLAVASSDVEDRKSFFIRHGWISHLRKNFFMQEPELTDTYTRTKTLELFEKYPLIYSKETNIDAGRKSVYYRTAVDLFKSHERFVDMFLISEGYIESSGGKYDKLLSTAEFKDTLKNTHNGNIDNFRLFNGRDEILFSFDLIKQLIDEEAVRFNRYVSEYAIEDPFLDFSRMFKEPFEILKGDKRALAMLRGLKTPAKIEEEEDMPPAELIKRIQFIFEVYFRQIAIFHIINQYINLPAGTVVVRMDDYTIRMITEIYDETCIVSLVPDKNDGSTEIFNGDSLANLFLISWNYYNYTVDNSFRDRVERIFNFRDEKVEEAQALEGMEASERQAEEVTGILSQTLE